MTSGGTSPGTHPSDFRSRGCRELIGYNIVYVCKYNTMIPRGSKGRPSTEVSGTVDPRITDHGIKKKSELKGEGWSRSDLDRGDHRDHPTDARCDKVKDAH